MRINPAGKEDIMALTPDINYSELLSTTPLPLSVSEMLVDNDKKLDKDSFEMIEDNEILIYPWVRFAKNESGYIQVQYSALFTLQEDGTVHGYMDAAEDECYYFEGTPADADFTIADETYYRLNDIVNEFHSEICRAIIEKLNTDLPSLAGKFHMAEWAKENLGIEIKPAKDTEPAKDSLEAFRMAAAEEIRMLAKSRAVEVPAVYGDGTETTELVVPYSELSMILHEVLEYDEREHDDTEER